MAHVMKMAGVAWSRGGSFVLLFQSCVSACLWDSQEPVLVDQHWGKWRAEKVGESNCVAKINPGAFGRYSAAAIRPERAALHRR